MQLRTSFLLKPVIAFLLYAYLLGAHLSAQTQAPPNVPARAGSAPSTTVPALFLSDIHFDPLRDPAKAARLNVAPLSEWAAILAAPPTPTAAADYAAINSKCPIKPLVDTDNNLLQSTLDTVHANAFANGQKISFVVLAGDIVGHQFDCRYNVLFPHSTHAQFLGFVEKTASYVVAGLRKALPGIPIYMTLGNDDTGCHDNSLTPGEDDFLRFAARLIAQSLPPGDRPAALRDFRHGYYAASLPAPLAGTRILVLDNVYQMTPYRSCNANGGPPPSQVSEMVAHSGRLAPTAQNAQLSWLATQLDDVRAHHQQAWVVAHVPPGVNPYSTFNASRIYKVDIDVCHGGSPISFLSSDQLPQLLAINADIVRLALFGHAHTDEMRLITPSLGLSPIHVSATVSGPVQPDLTNAGVPGKILPSISPVFAGLPSFTLAQIDGRTASLNDYTVILASNSTGIDTQWAPSYTFSTTYRASSFTPDQLAPLITGLESDRTGSTAASQAYMREYRHYFFDDSSTPLPSVWPLLACSIDHISAAAFTTCACAK